MIDGIGSSLQPVFAQEGYAGHHASSFGHRAAAPRVSRRAKRGGARRDRTADLLHAMQALSQLSYGPVTLSSEHDCPENLFSFSGSCSPRVLGDAGENPEHSSGSISSLLVAADVADDVGDVLVAFFLVGDEGGIVVIVVFNGLVDLDVVFGLRNHGLDLAGVFLGVGFLER